MNPVQPPQVDWQKCDGLVPAVVQHAQTGAVLMLGYMNAAALAQTIESRRVTFFSRTRQRLWTKGETSGNWLDLVELTADCDQDTLLVRALPAGPVCHTGALNCFPDAADLPATKLAFLDRLESVIAGRIADRPEGSYTARLFADGPKRIAQKVGEEGLEVALAAVGEDDDAKVIGEAADLTYHLLLLLKQRGLTLGHVVDELAARNAAKP